MEAIYGLVEGGVNYSNGFIGFTVMNGYRLFNILVELVQRIALGKYILSHSPGFFHDAAMIFGWGG